MPTARTVKFSAGTRRSFAALTRLESAALVARFDEIAARIPEARPPYHRVTQVGNLRVSYEVRATDVCVWSITRDSTGER